MPDLYLSITLSFAAIVSLLSAWRISNEYRRPRGYFIVVDHLGLNVWPGWHEEEACESIKINEQSDVGQLRDLSNLSAYELHGAWLPWQRMHIKHPSLGLMLHRKDLEVTLLDPKHLSFRVGSSHKRVALTSGDKITVYPMQAFGNLFLLFSSQAFDEAAIRILKLRT